MSALHAFVLAIVQGLTSFVPVSASGHLTLVPFVLGWREPTATFVLAANLGVLIAVTYVLRAQVLALVRAVANYRGAPEGDRLLLRAVAVGILPAVIVGIAAQRAIGDVYGKPVLASVLLGVTGYWLVSCESRRHEREVDPVEAQTPLRTEVEIGSSAAVGVGIAQATAVLPGISRTGAAIGEAMRRGMTRDAAVRFAFLLSIPILFGAVVTQIPGALRDPVHGQALSFAVGLVVSGVVGFFAVGWTMRIVTMRGLRGFGLYCFAAMVAGLITALARG